MTIDRTTRRGPMPAFTAWLQRLKLSNPRRVAATPQRKLTPIAEVVAAARRRAQPPG